MQLILQLLLLIAIQISGTIAAQPVGVCSTVDNVKIFDVLYCFVSKKNARKTQKNQIQKPQKNTMTKDEFMHRNNSRT